MESNTSSTKQHDINIQNMLKNAEVGICPSCHKMMAIPALMDLEEMNYCPFCGAAMYPYKAIEAYKNSDRKFKEDR